MKCYLCLRNGPEFVGCGGLQPAVLAAVMYCGVTQCRCLEAAYGRYGLASGQCGPSRVLEASLRVRLSGRRDAAGQRHGWRSLRQALSHAPPRCKVVHESRLMKKTTHPSPKTRATSTPRTSVTFPTDLYKALEELARKKKVSLAWIVRDAAERYVSAESHFGASGVSGRAL
jgi:hypothetical protein